MSRLKIFRLVIAMALVTWSCDQQNAGLNPQSVEKLTIDVAQTSGQLASGTDFNIQGSSSCDSTGGGPGFRKGPHGGPGGRNAGILDGLNLLAPTDELLAIVDAESASDIRGFRISQNGGATITNYDANGNEVSLPLPGKNGPQGCSFSGKQFPSTDSLLSKIAKTVIDFGNGVMFKRDTVEIVRSGKIVIERTVSGTSVREITTFDNYKVNGIKIEGTKTRTSSFDEETRSGASTTSVANGKITFTDGTVATWTSDRSRVSDLSAGTITTTVDASVVASGTVIYSHKSATPLVEKLSCERPSATIAIAAKSGPVSGVVETVYRTNNISIDFGNGSCTNRTITITVNGTTTTRTIGE
jgi:hypothetical protein